MLNILALIPARGGSKGLPGKNVLELAGKPLIAHSIESAKRCRYINKIVVTTDCLAISQTAKMYGAEVPFLRPDYLASDRADFGSAIDWTLTRLEEQGYVPDIYVILTPTSPFRSDSLLLALVELLIAGYSHVMTVKHINLPPSSLYFLSNRSALERIRPSITHTSIESENWSRAYGIFSGHNNGGTLGKYVYTVDDPLALIDIDTEDDFIFANWVIMNSFPPEVCVFYNNATALPRSEDDVPDYHCSFQKLQELEICEAAIAKTRLKPHTERNHSSMSESFHLFSQTLHVNLANEIANNLQLQHSLCPYSKFNTLSILDKIALTDPCNKFLADCMDKCTSALETGKVLSDIPAFVLSLAAEHSLKIPFAHRNVAAIFYSQALIKGFFQQAKALFHRIPWSSVNIAPYLVDQFFKIHKNTFRAEASMMLLELENNLLSTFMADKHIQKTYGTACAYAGMGDQADRYLKELLPLHEDSPEQLLDIVYSLLAANQLATLHEFFNYDVMSRICNANYDIEQLERLSAVLFNVGIKIPAQVIYSSLLSKIPVANCNALPKVAFAIIRTTEYNNSLQIIDSYIEQHCHYGSLQQTIALSETYVIIGEIDKAVDMLSSLDTTAKYTAADFMRIFTLLERVGLVDNMKTLYSHNICDCDRFSLTNLFPTYLMHFYEHKLRSFANSLCRNNHEYSGDQSAQFLLYLSLLWTGAFTQATSLMNKFPESSTLFYYFTHVHCALAERRLNDATIYYRGWAKIYTDDALNVNTRMDKWQPFFEWAILERHLGNHKLALDIISDCLVIENTHNNPCKALYILVMHEYANRHYQTSDADMFVDIADKVCLQRCFASPWLYLHAAFIYLECGDQSTAFNILEHRLATCVYFSQTAKETIRTIAMAQPANGFQNYADELVHSFFPELEGSYWHEFLKSDIARHGRALETKNFISANGKSLTLPGKMT